MIRGEPSLVSMQFLRPVWFIQRDNGNYVPVLAVDELPIEVHLEGVPRSMNLDDAQGMKFLGNLRYTGQTYSLLARNSKVAEALGANYMPPTMAQIQHFDHHMELQSTAPSKPETAEVERKPSSAVNEEIVRASPEVVSRLNYTGHPPLPPSGKQPDQTKKVYCTFWIKNGGCDFTQQGCRYKHEIPDLKTLREKIGINYIPKRLIGKTPGCNPGPPTWMKERIRAHDAALTKLPPVQHMERDCDGNDVDASSGSENEQSRPSNFSRQTAAVAGARHLSSFKAPDADYNQKAKDAGPCSHEPASDTELNYVCRPLAHGQKLHRVLERAFQTCAPSRHLTGTVGEAKAGSVTANLHHRKSSFSGLRDPARRSPPKKEVHDFFQYIRKIGDPPASTSPVYAPQLSGAQGTTVVHQTRGYVKKLPDIHHPTSTAASPTTTGASASADYFNISALKPKPLAIASKLIAAGSTSPNDLATQGGLHSSRHAPNPISSEAPRSDTQHQHLLDLDFGDFDHESRVNSANPAPRSRHCVTPIEAHHAVENEAGFEELVLVNEHDSGCSINSGPSSSGSSGRGTRTRSSSLDWDSEVPNFEPSRVVEPANRMKRSPRTSHSVNRNKFDKRVSRQKPIGGSTPGSRPSTGITTPTAPLDRKHSGVNRGGVRPAKMKRPAVAGADAVGNKAGPPSGPKSEEQRKEGKVVPTEIRRAKVAKA